MDWLANEDIYEWLEPVNSPVWPVSSSSWVGFQHFYNPTQLNYRKHPIIANILLSIDFVEEGARVRREINGARE